MKIVLVCKGNLKSAGMRNFGYDLRYLNGLVRNGHCVNVYNVNDRIKALSAGGIFKKAGHKRMNRDFIKFIDHYRPDAIILSHTNAVLPETYQAVREKYPELKIAHVNVDCLYSSENQENLKKWARVTDAGFITTGGNVLSRFNSADSKFYFMPNIVDASIDTGRAFDLSAPPYDVCCFMNDDGSDAADNRVATALAVQNDVAGIQTHYRGFNGQPPISGAEQVDVYGHSAMALNLSRIAVNGRQSDAEERYLYSSDRIAQIMGNGCLAFLQRGFALENLYREDQDAVFFNDVNDLVTKVAYYKNTPAERQKIAQSGWARSHKYFNEKVVMRYVIETLFAQTPRNKYLWQEL